MEYETNAMHDKKTQRLPNPTGAILTYGQQTDVFVACSADKKSKLSLTAATLALFQLDSLFFVSEQSDAVSLLSRYF